MRHLVGIVGSGSQPSTNEQLLNYIKKNYADEFKLILVNPSDWPLFDKPFGTKLPTIVEETAKLIDSSDGVIISAAEYDHSISAVLSNVLAWLSFTIYPLVGKPILTLGTSYGRLGSSRAQAHLHQVLDAPQIHAAVMPGSEFLLSYAQQAFDDNGDLMDPDDVTELDSLINQFEKFIAIYQAMDTHAADAKTRAQNYDEKYTFIGEEI